jgi:hypothetical protein
LVHAKHVHSTRHAPLDGSRGPLPIPHDGSGGRKPAFLSLHLLTLATLTLWSTNAVAQDAPDPALKGNVHSSHVRVKRPGAPALPSTTPSNLQGQVDAQTFSKLHQPAAVESPATLDSGAMEIDTPPLSPSFSTTPSSEQHPAIKAGTERTEDKAPATAGTTSAVSSTTPANSTGIAVGKEITIRLKRFRALSEMDVVFEALKMANRMQLRGGQVTVLLDMEAVHAADRQDTAFAEFERHRGEGSYCSERFQTVQALMREFIGNKGTVIVSARWAHIFLVKEGEMVPGVKLETDDEIADHLLNTGNILDY